MLSIPNASLVTNFVSSAKLVLMGTPVTPPAPIPSQHEFMEMLAATVTVPATGLDQPTL